MDHRILAMVRAGDTHAMVLRYHIGHGLRGRVNDKELRTK